MRVLVACEFSGVVRRAFRALGHDAWSCDLLPAEDGSEYPYQGDVLYWDSGPWDLMIAHPPCTYLSRAGARWWKAPGRAELADRAAMFVYALRDLPIERIAIENPIGQLNQRWRYPDQTIQPWQFGDPYTKATCLWLKNLPLLKPTNIVEGRHARVHREAPSPDRWKNRSRTLPGIAAAMAEQWGTP